MRSRLLTALILPLWLVFCAQAADRIPRPPVVAPGAFLMDAASGDALWQRNADEPRCMASTTKMMTALLAVESGHLDDIVTVSPNAAKIPESSLNLKPFERITLLDLTRGVILRSANDAAVAVAEYLGGTEQGFVDQMNARAAQLGCANTHFLNPNGLHVDGHVSSPRDLAIIGRAVLANDTLRDIVRLQQYTIERSINRGDRHVASRIRWFLKGYPGADGIKSGHTRQAGRCFVASATRGGRRLIGVVLNSPNVRKDIKALLDWGFANTQTVRVMREGEALGTVTVKGGTRPDVAVRAGRSVWVATLKGSPPSRVEQNPIPTKAPVEAGATIGEVLIFTPGRAPISVPLIATAAVDVSVVRKAGRFGLWTAIAVLVVFILGTITETAIRRRRLLKKRSGGVDPRRARSRQRNNGRRRGPG